MRTSWTPLLLVTVACGGEVTSDGGGSASGGTPGTGGASAAPGGGFSTGGRKTPGSPRYTGEPGVALVDGHTCTHAPLPPGLPILESMCRSAADCTSEPNGRCVGRTMHLCRHPSGGRWDPDWDRGLPCEPYVARMETIEPDCEGGQCFQFLQALCVYDACSSDSECHAGERCSCDPRGNRCVRARCFGDSECPAGERCAAVPSFCDPDIGAYACTTAYDACEPGDACGAMCAPSTEGPWECMEQPYCGR